MLADAGRQQAQLLVGELGQAVVDGRLGTVRGWLRRFGADADAIREHFTRWAFALDPELGLILSAGSAFADALEAIAVAARAWVLRFGPPAVMWRLVAALSGGALLCHTSCPFPAVP